MSEHIRYEVADRVATITIDRPERKNAMTFAMNRAFGKAIHDASEDPAVQVLIVTGAGGAFCAGTDLSDLDERSPEDRFGDGGRRERASESFWPLVQCPKPVIGAIDGPAVGMGAEFTSHCDVRIASTRARIAWLFGKRGLVPDTGAGSWLLPRLIGPQRALELLFTGRFVEAEEALEDRLRARRGGTRSTRRCRPCARRSDARLLPFRNQPHQASGLRWHDPRRRQSRGSEHGCAGGVLCERRSPGGGEGFSREAFAPVHGSLTNVSCQ